MRTNHIWIILALAGCAPSPLRPSPPADATAEAARAATPSPPTAATSSPPPATPRKVELTEGKPVDLGDGTTLLLKSVLYAHLSNSRNRSMLTMEVTRDGKQEQVTLDRLDPVGAEGPKYRPVMGHHMAIDYVDAYHQVSTAAVLVLPE